MNYCIMTHAHGIIILVITRAYYSLHKMVLLSLEFKTIIGFWILERIISIFIMILLLYTVLYI